MSSNSRNPKHCKVAGCKENHSSHYCKSCENNDSNHFSHACPKNPDKSHAKKNENYPKSGPNFTHAPHQEYPHRVPPSEELAGSEPSNNHSLENEQEDTEKQKGKLSKEKGDNSNARPQSNNQSGNYAQEKEVPKREQKDLNREDSICNNKNKKMEEINPDVNIIVENKQVKNQKKKNENQSGFWFCCFSRKKKKNNDNKSKSEKSSEKNNKKKIEITIEKKNEIKNKLEMPLIDFKQDTEIINLLLSIKNTSINQIPDKVFRLYELGSSGPVRRMDNLSYLHDSRQIKNSHDLYAFIASLAIQVKISKLDYLDLSKMLRCQSQKEITFKKQEIANILSLMFWGLIPNRPQGYNSPKIVNFEYLFSSYDEVNRQKILCILNYFERVLKWTNKESATLDETVTFKRKVSKDSPSNSKQWSRSNEELSQFQLLEDGTIEQQTFKNCLEVDFANKMIGGGVLKSGSVQEEIMFMVRPECLVSLLFFEELADNEVAIIEGTDKVNRCEGYKQSFRFIGDFDTSIDASQSRTSILAIDALDFTKVRTSQFSKENILRELNKASLGFSEKGIQNVVTGKWGCGVFKGDPVLKFLVQWLAASKAKASMKFCTLRDQDFLRYFKIFNDLTKTQKTVGGLFTLIINYEAAWQKGNLSFVDYLFSYKVNSKKANK